MNIFQSAFLSSAKKHDMDGIFYVQISCGRWVLALFNNLLTEDVTRSFCFGFHFICTHAQRCKIHKNLFKCYLYRMCTKNCHSLKFEYLIASARQTKLNSLHTELYRFIKIWTNNECIEFFFNIHLDLK